MSSDLVETQLQGIHQPVRSEKSPRGAARILISVLHHFEHVASSTIGSLQIQARMRTRVLSLAQDSPILMNAIFAFSANHLHTLRPDDAKMRITALHHTSLALQLYIQEVNGSHTEARFEATIAASVLVSAVIFFAEHGSPSSSFVFSDDAQAADWLLIITGVGELFARRGIKPVVARRGLEATPAGVLEPGRRDLHAPFVELCNIDDASTSANNPYHAELRLLTQMMAVPATQETFSELIRFPCQMGSAFITLLRGKDPVALLMLAYWFAKLGEVDFWWIRTRARSECFAICSYLDGWPDERFQPLLQVPMEACGYVPIDVGMIEAYVFGM